GPDVTADRLRDHLAHLKDFAGANGTYDFEKEPQRGLTVENAVVTRWNRASKHWDVLSKPTGVPLEKSVAMMSSSALQGGGVRGGGSFSRRDLPGEHQDSPTSPHLSAPKGGEE